MIQRHHIACLTVLAAGFLVACTEKPQTGQGIRTDKAPYAGTNSNFMDPHWKAGDKVGWEQQLRTRQQYGQNEYTRTQ